MTKPPATVTVKNLRRSVVEKLPAGHSLNGAAPTETPPDAFVQEVMRDRGQPAFENDKGKLSQLNELFWAHLWAKENTACYLPSEGRFYLYNADNGAFEPLSEDALRTRLGARIQKAAACWGETWFPLQRFCSAKVLAGIIQQLKGILEGPGFFSTPPCHFIHCFNGVVQLNAAGEVNFKSFSDHYRSRRPSPIAYDSKAQCHDFKRMLLGHLDGDDQELLQKTAGQCLIGSNLTQRIVILDGPGRASKGAFASVLREVVGRQSCGELRTHLLKERFEVGRLMTKSLVLGADVAGNFLSTPEAAILKSLVGGDWKDFELKNSNDTGGGVGLFNVVITANSRLRVRLEGDRSAWARRLTIVRYDRPFVGNKIPDVHLMLLAKEGPGILNWCIQGAQKLLQDIESGGDMLLSDNQKQRVDDLLDESDSLSLFLKECVQTTSDGSDLSSEEIIRAYAQFCIGRKWDMMPASVAERRLPDQMSQLFGVLKSHSIERGGKGRNGYPAVKFRNAGDESHEGA